MLVGLHDSDKTRFPNLALMKISAWHKAQGDAVEWWNPMTTYDARLITPEVAVLLAKLKWIRFIRMSCDTDAMLGVVINKIQMLGEHGVKPYRVLVYLLVQDIPSAEKRAIALREIGAEVFAQPYRDFENNIEPTSEMKAFARWVNRKAISRA